MTEKFSKINVKHQTINLGGLEKQSRIDTQSLHLAISYSNFKGKKKIKETLETSHILKRREFSSRRKEKRL